MSEKTPSNFQQAITGQWHGSPSLFEADGTHRGYSKVTRASEFKDGRTTYWMDTRFDATGPLHDRFEMGARFNFGVIDSDQDRIYTGPDFYGSGKPYGLLVDSNYYSPGWNTNLRTVNLIVPEIEMQVYSSQLFEGDTLIGVFNGLYIVTQDHETNPDTQAKVTAWLDKEKVDGKKPFAFPVKNKGRFVGEFECYDENQNLIGTNKVTIHHTPINLLHCEQTIEITGVINKKWTCMRARNGNHQQFHGPDIFGNGMSYGRYLYSVRHVVGEPVRLWSRETLVDDDYTLVCVWQFIESQKEKYTTFGVLRWQDDGLLLDAQYID